MIGETANVLEVTEGMVGQKISVTATDADGEVLESLETDAVKGEDKSAEVSIVDAYGTNADGTGIVGDRLELTYGVDFGTPSHITWYRNGSVVATMGQGGTDLNNDGGLFLNVTAARGTGIYKATVVANGKTYETNEIEISSKEDPAVIESFTIEDDYTDGTDVTYAATDTTAVATVKMNKNFQGTFRIYKKTDSKFATTVDTLTTALAPANGITAAADDVASTSGDGASHLVANAATNYNVLQMTAGSGEGFIARDGKVTYKFAVNAGLVRGTEYVVVFDQTSRSDDNIGSGTENKFATAVTAPYLTAPATAEITKAAKNAAVEITFKDKEGNILTYMGKQTARAGVATTTPASTNGIRVKAGSAIYSATKSGVEIKDATNQNTAQNIALTAGAVKAGVWTSGVTVTGTDAFWFANITFEKGVYGKDEIAIRTADKQVAQDAGAATISYNVKAPKDAKVSFTNLRAKSTVYLVCLNDTNAGGKSTAQPTVSNETASTAFKRVYENPTTEAVASATVEPGTATYTFEGAIDGIHMGDGLSTTLPGNSYIAVIVPDDETNYSPTYTAIGNPTYTAGDWGTTANGFDVTATLVSYKLNSWFATSGNTVTKDATNVYCVEDGAVVHGNPAATAAKADGYLLEFIDQFGNHMDQTNTATEDHTWNFTPDDSEMDQDAAAQIVFASGATTSTKTAVNGKLFDTMSITVTKGASDTALKKGQSFSAKLATGQTLSLTATAAAAGVEAGAYTLSIK